MKERQVRYTTYLGTLVELDSKAETYRKAALAEAINRYAGKYSPSLMAKIAEKIAPTKQEYSKQFIG